MVRVSEESDFSPVLGLFWFFFVRMSSIFGSWTHTLCMGVSDCSFFVFVLYGLVVVRFLGFFLIRCDTIWQRYMLVLGVSW